MTFKGGIEKSSNRARTGGRGGQMAVGGGIGGLLMVGLFLLLGGNPADLGQITGGGQQPQGEDPGLVHCKTTDDANKYADCRVEFTALNLDAMWEEVLPQQAGIEYEEPGLVVFEGQTQSGCGFASSNTGPFYCGGDSSAYFDVSFFDQLERLGGDNAPLAQMYIVAHEFGHHIQKLEGTIGMIDYNNPGEDSTAVKLELQADCYAGMWVNRADEDQEFALEKVTPEQVESAINTARAVGDDNIQKRSTGEVQPDLWTHGSSQQRQDAFLKGYNEGTMAACDYLETGNYRS
ncbi:neutral zinc metallopeptidase [Corynebacterium breve]|uniref:Neutral zinc metallopeptidase n=1 Tax=Corynebacterium breve TaxID=3049799 RepID=A0ABY8VJI2_9CORY|nr:neutral zinc metallopeptidase [Corynebacterium breve]WIM68935.1 neutral zinc metallopeptidase [Corynebacterium breve]